jgi:hypothetical protein
MNKKLVSMLMLVAVAAQGRNDVTDCAPQGALGAQDNIMMVGASVGVASMKNPVYGSTTYTFPQSLTSDLADATADITGATSAQLCTPVGYRANLNALTPSAEKMGFAGVLDVHYAMRHGDFGVGV